MTVEHIGDDMCLVLVGYDDSAAAAGKGVSEPVTNWINGKVNKAGCAGTAITIRSYQEEAVVASKKSVAICRGRDSDARIAGSRIQSK